MCIRDSDSNDLEIRKEEQGTPTALLRGICYRMKEQGYTIGGFDAYISSEIPQGSGLSSSAAFEVLMVTILNHLYPVSYTHLDARYGHTWGKLLFRLKKSILISFYDTLLKLDCQI